VIVYLPRRAMTTGMHLMLVDRKGSALQSIGEVADYSSPRVFPDGVRLAVARRDPVSGTRDIWAGMRRVCFGGTCRFPTATASSCCRRPHIRPRNR